MNNVQAHMMGPTAVVPLKNIERMEIEQQQDDNEEVDDERNDDNNASDASSSSSSSDDSSDEASSSSSTTTSSDGDETQQGGKTFELTQITDEVLHLPRNLCEYESIFREFFTEELWNELSAEQRARLQDKLPDFNALLEPNEALAEQRHTVHLLFQDKLARFGRTPLGELYRNLEAGNYRPDIKVWRQSIHKSQRREQRFRECERLGVMAKRLFIAREHLLRSAYSSIPDESLRLERSLQKQQSHHSFLFNADTKISAVRARKRFYMEIAELKKRARLQKNDILSADEEDGEAEEENSSTQVQDYLCEEMTVLKSTAAVTTATDKCIYDTFFKRRPDFTDEESMRLSQYAKRPKLTNRNYRQYLLDYKRKKLLEPNLPDYETADIRLRDVCSRAQISNNFKRSFPLGQKPGRKSKLKLNESPALVSAKKDASLQNKTFNDVALNQNLNSMHLQQQPQQQQSTLSHTVNTANYLDDMSPNDAFNVYDGEVEVQTEEVETYSDETLSSSYGFNNEAMNAPSKSTSVIQTLAKLEPIAKRDQMNTPIQLKPVAMGTSVSHSTFNSSLQMNSSASELLQETHACFFSLIRDFFCATQNHRMKFDELKQRIQIWLSNPITALNDWYTKSNNWAALLTSAVKFLAGDFVEQPEEYVPYIDYKAQMNIYQWIGASRDSDARLTDLCNYWMQHRKDFHVAKTSPAQKIQQLQLNVIRSGGGVSDAINQNEMTQMDQNNGLVPSKLTPIAATLPTPIPTINAINLNSGVSTTPPPPPRCPTTWTVRPFTADEIREFQRQERERFEQPHRAFTYRMHGYESVVGPVRGIYSQTLALTKARGHSMMVDDRPNFVTILTLVRDATARLPNGEGTRSDISELLKCSQYINTEAAENVMQTIVSGALDRLHTESDPCVRYDPKRKIWIYLHRNRSEAEFERIHQQLHQQQLQSQSKTNKFVKTSMTVTDAAAAAAAATRKVLPKTTVIKTLSARDGVPAQALSHPALVSTTPPIIITTQTAGNKLQQQQQQALSKPVLAAPALKYNMTTSPVAQQQQQQQKSLLKTTINTQRRFVDAKTGATVLTSGTIAPQRTAIQNTKPVSFQLSQGNKLVNVNTTTSASNATAIKTMAATATGTANKSPFIVATSSAVQTLHVPPSSMGTITTGAASSSNLLTATVAGKRVALSKPIIISQVNKTQQTPVNRANATQIITTTTTPKQAQAQKQQQGFIIPINAANSNVQLQLQHAANSSSTSAIQRTNKSGVHTIMVDSNAPTFTTINAAAATNEPNKCTTTTTTKNVIRFVPNMKQQQQQQQQQQQIVGNKFIGQRVISTTNTSNLNNNLTTIRNGGTKILSTPTASCNSHGTTTTMLANNATIVSTSNVGVGGVSNPPGTIIKMTPQAFNALQKQQQQKQQLQHIVKTATGSNVTTTQQQQPQQQQQQRLIIGNTAIIAHATGNTKIASAQQQQSLSPTPAPTPAKALGSATIITNTKAVSDAITSTSVAGVSNNVNKIQMVNASNLTPQQQRVLIQNFKQQQQQQKQNIASKPLAVVVSQSPTGITRVLKTTMSPASASPLGTTATSTTTAGNATKVFQSSTGTGQIVTIDSLIQQQQQQQQQQQHDGNSGTIITPLSVAQFNNIITLGSPQQRLITTQATSSTTPTGANNLRLIQTSGGGGGGTATGNLNVPGTFSIANIQGKQVLFATKTPSNAKQLIAGGSSAVSSGNSGGSGVIFGGQTLKLQANQLQNLTKTSGAATTPSTSQTSQMQTVIMGNQILRVLPKNKGSTANATSMGTTSLPKTLVLGGNSNSENQTMRIQNAASVTSQQESTQTTSQKTTATAAATGNRLVLAVQGGGQILLPSNFSSGTLNLKSLQNMKLVSLTQVPQQLQDKTKISVTNAANSPKTVVKSIGNNNSTAIG